MRVEALSEVWELASKRGIQRIARNHMGNGPNDKFGHVRTDGVLVLVVNLPLASELCLSGLLVLVLYRCAAEEVYSPKWRILKLCPIAVAVSSAIDAD